MLTIGCGLLLLVNFLYVAVGVARYGSHHIDAYGIWMLKGEAFVVEGGAPLKLLRESDFSYSHQQYPLLLPALMGEFSRVFGIIDSFLLLYPLIYGLILYFLYTLLRLERVSFLPALVSVTVASFMGPLLAQGGRLHAGLADIWITLAVVLAMLAVKSKKPWWLAVIILVATQIKLEGILLMAFWWGFKNEWKRWRPLMGLSLTSFGWWQWQVTRWHLPTDLGFYWPGLGGLFSRVAEILRFTGREMLNWRNWYVVWPLFWLSLVLNRGAKKKSRWLSILGIMAGGFMGVYLLSILEPTTYVASSIDRLMLQLLPLWWVIMTKGVVGFMRKS